MILAKLKEIPEYAPIMVGRIAKVYNDNATALTPVKFLSITIERGESPHDSIHTLSLAHGSKTDFKEVLPAVIEFVNGISSCVNPNDDDCITVLMRTIGTDKQHELYVLRHRASSMDFNQYKDLVEKFSTYKLDSIDTLMLAKGFDIVYDNWVK